MKDEVNLPINPAVSHRMFEREDVRSCHPILCKDGWMAHSPGHFTVKPSNGPGNDLGARLYSVSGVKVPTKSYICMPFILGRKKPRGMCFPWGCGLYVLGVGRQLCQSG